jgi:hypothetical protein
MKKQNCEQKHDGHALKQWCDASKDVLADDVEHHPLECEEGGGRERSAREDSYGVCQEMTEKVRQLGNQRHEKDAEKAGAKQYKTEKDSERRHSREKQMPADYWLNR